MTIEDHPVSAAEAAAARAGVRYEQRRQAVIAAATRLINEHGVKGMRLADVAVQLGLSANSVGYYYKRKEDLAVACFEAGLETMTAMVTEAGEAATPPDRVRRFIRLYLCAHARIRLGEQAPISIFSDIRALKEPHHSRLVRGYGCLLRGIAALLEGPDTEWMGEAGRAARAQLILEQALWAEAWLPRYSPDDFPRVQARVCDILENGLAAAGCVWDPAPLEVRAAERIEPPTPQEAFLRAATRLINRRGYRGASVSDIAAELKVTKGSFYHHHDAKDEVVVACFERTYRTMRQVQRQVRALDGDEWRRLSTAAAALVAHQLSPEGPLLRTAAFSALPPEMRGKAVDMSRRVSDHFASMVSDGIAEGCIRPVDPMIAAEMLSAMINAASDLPWQNAGFTAESAPGLYARPLLVGLFTR